MRTAVIASVAVLALLASASFVSAGKDVAFGFVREDGQVASAGGNWKEYNFNITKADIGIYCVGGNTGTYATVIVTPQNPNVVGYANTGTGNVCNQYGGTLIGLTVATTGQPVDSPFTFAFMPGYAF